MSRLQDSLLAGRTRVEDDGWLPVADLMAGLMMVFVLVAMVALKQLVAASEAEEEAVPPEPVAQAPARADAAASAAHDVIAESLQRAFGEQLQLWDARLDRSTLSIDFGAPEINFAPGSVEIGRRYRVILQDFFPRYLRALAPHAALIDEVRIEGHASSDWSSDSDATNAWFENMALSQERTRAVLRYLYELPSAADYRDWVRERVVAVGLSSARTVRNADGSENAQRSRRVSFRLITRADAALGASSG